MGIGVRLRVSEILQFGWWWSEMVLLRMWDLIKTSPQKVTDQAMLLCVGEYSRKMENKCETQSQRRVWCQHQHRLVYREERRQGRSRRYQIREMGVSITWRLSGHYENFIFYSVEWEVSGEMWAEKWHDLAYILHHAYRIMMTFGLLPPMLIYQPLCRCFEIEQGSFSWGREDSTVEADVIGIEGVS